MNAKKIWIAYQTIVIKEFFRCLRIWPQTIMPPAITTTLYFIIFGKLVGSQIKPLYGFTYMQFIVPGLVLMQVVINAYVNASSSFFGAKFQRYIEELLVSPTPNVIILLGYVTGGLVRACIVASIVITIALLFTHLEIQHPGLMIFTIVMLAIFFSIAGVINAIFAYTFDDVSWVPSFVLTPLTYLGGVFFSIKMLPSLWQKIALLNPVLYLIDLFRYSVLGVQEASITVALTILFMMTFGLFFYALHLLAKSPRLRS